MPEPSSSNKTGYWIGLIIIGILFITYFGYDAPVSGGHYELNEAQDRVGAYVWVEEKDYSNAPGMVKFVDSWNGLLLILGGVCVYGVFKKD